MSFRTAELRRPTPVCSWLYCSEVNGEAGSTFTVEHIALRTVCPPIANVYRRGHVRARHKNGGAVDGCSRRHILAIPARNFKPSESAAFGAESPGVVEPCADGAGFEGGLPEYRSGVFDILAIREDPRRTGQAHTHVQFVCRVNIIGVPNVDCDCHGSVAHGERAYLLFAKFGPVLQRSRFEI